MRSIIVAALGLGGTLVLTTLELLQPGSCALQAVGGSHVEHQETVNVLDAQVLADVRCQEISVPDERYQPSR